MPIYILIDTFQTIDAIMIDAIKNIPVHMDFVGQGRAEKLYQIIIVLFGVVGLVWGFMSGHRSLSRISGWDSITEFVLLAPVVGMRPLAVIITTLDA